MYLKVICRGKEKCVKQRVRKGCNRIRNDKDEKGEVVIVTRGRCQGKKEVMAGEKDFYREEIKVIRTVYVRSCGTTRWQVKLQDSHRHLEAEGNKLRGFFLKVNCQGKEKGRTGEGMDPEFQENLTTVRTRGRNSTPLYPVSLWKILRLKCKFLQIFLLLLSRLTNFLSSSLTSGLHFLSRLTKCLHNQKQTDERKTE